MTPDETSPVPVNEHMLAQMMACDALLHADRAATDRGPDGSDAAATADDLARSRLLLLLRLLDAAEAPSGPTSDDGVARVSDGFGENPTLLSRFEILEDLGSGGFGFVVRAHDRLLGREVALKMPLPERALGPGDVRRFLREAQAAARLDHPHIVRVFDAGELGPLGYFIAAEFCAGPSLRQWLKAQNAPVPARTAAGWVAALADAAQHAHERGILHRDIKPDNVIMAAAPGPERFIPRLTDFGLAKVIEEAGDETRSGSRVGTPHYMAPEQAAGHHREVGPATDVYALGATLYEVLTGRPPFRGESEAETLRLVLDAEPVAPRSLRPGLPRDLETICLKCLRKEPARRYGTAADLCDDLRRFLEGRQIRARRASVAEVAWRWCLRNKAVAGLLGAVFLLLATVAGIASVGYVREAAARAAAESAELRAEDEALRAHAAELEMRRQWYAATINLMQPAWDAGQVGRLRELLSATEGYPDRGFEWSYYQRLCHLERGSLIGHRAGVRSVAWSPDGTRLATASWDMTARVWDAATRRELIALKGHTSGIASVSWSRDGMRLATASTDGTAKVWNAADGHAQLTLDGHAAPVLSVAWSPDGKRLATGSQDGTARVWDAHDGRELRAITAHDGVVMAVAWSPDGRRLATAGRDRTARVWDPDDGRELLILNGHAGEVWSVSWSPDGKRVGTGSDDATARIWVAATGRELIALKGHTSRVMAVAWSPDGRRLATESGDGTTRVWDAADGREILALKGHVFGVSSVSWSPDGLRLATGSEDGTVKVWDAAAGRDVLALKEPMSGVISLAWRPNGLQLATGSFDGMTRVWDATDGRVLRALGGHTSRVNAVAWSPDGTRLATGSRDGTVKLWDHAAGRDLLTIDGEAGEVRAVAWSPDGRRLAMATWDRTAKVWDAGGRRLFALEGQRDSVTSLAWSRDGTRLATASTDRTTRVWDAATGHELLAMRVHTGDVLSVAWAPDGRRLATASQDRTARVWDPDDGRELFVLKGHAGPVLCVAWSPDGRRLATGSRDMTAKVWNAADGRELLTLKGHSGRVNAVAWSPDGLRLATGGFDGTTNVWDAAGTEAAERWARQDRAVVDLLARNAFRGPRARGFIRDWLLLLPLPLVPGEPGAGHRAAAAPRRGGPEATRGRAGLSRRREADLAGVPLARSGTGLQCRDGPGDRSERRLRRLLHRQRPRPGRTVAASRQR